MTPSASPHAATTVHVRPSPQPRPLVTPDVRSYRIRLSDDHSAQGIHRESTALLLQVDQPQVSQGTLQRRTAHLLAAPLAPRPQKTTKADLQIPIDLAEGRTGVAKTELAAPASQKPVDPPHYLRKRQVDFSARQPTQPLPHSIQRFGRGNYVQIPPASHEPTAIKAKGKTQKIQALPFLAQVDNPSLFPVQTQPQTLQHLTHTKSQTNGYLLVGADLCVRP